MNDNWVETIEIRTSQASATLVGSLLADLVSEREDECVDVFYRASLVGDFMVEIRHTATPVEPSGSALGFRIVTAVKRLGLVNHTVWIQSR